MGGDYYDRDVVYTSSASVYSETSTKVVGAVKEMHRDLNPNKWKDTKLPCKKANPIIFALDVTGSMGEWTRIIYDKMPMFYGQIMIQNYLKEPSISFCAIGDYTCDEAPLQVTDFAQGSEIDQLIAKMFLEGGGGGSCYESYELAAYFYNNHCELENSELPFFFVTGDESFYEKIPEKYITRIIGKSPKDNVINARECWKALLKKFNVFLIKKPYDEERKEVQILKQWIETIGEERVLKIEHPKACIDVILGAIAITSGNRTLNTYIEDMKARGQTPDRIEEVTKALQKYSSKFSEYKSKIVSKKEETYTNNPFNNNNINNSDFFNIGDGNSFSKGFNNSNSNPLTKMNSSELFNDEQDIKKIKLREDLIAMKNIFKNEIPEHLLCPITSDIFVDPVMTCDGHTYERKAIEAWFVIHNTSPQTNLTLMKKSLIPNYVIKQLVKAFYEENLDKIK
jgi:hypothetical protein